MVKLLKYNRRAEGYLPVAQADTADDARRIAIRKGEGSYSLRRTVAGREIVETFFVDQWRKIRTGH